MSFPIDLQKNMAKTQILFKKIRFLHKWPYIGHPQCGFHIIYQLLVMTWKLLHHLKHPSQDSFPHPHTAGAGWHYPPWSLCRSRSSRPAGRSSPCQDTPEQDHQRVMVDPMILIV